MDRFLHRRRALALSMLQVPLLIEIWQIRQIASLEQRLTHRRQAFMALGIEWGKRQVRAAHCGVFVLKAESSSQRKQPTGRNAQAFVTESKRSCQMLSVCWICPMRRAASGFNHQCCWGFWDLRGTSVFGEASARSYGTVAGSVLFNVKVFNSGELGRRGREGRCVAEAAHEKFGWSRAVRVSALPMLRGRYVLYGALLCVNVKAGEVLVGTRFKFNRQAIEIGKPECAGAMMKRLSTYRLKICCPWTCCSVWSEVLNDRCQWWSWRVMGILARTGEIWLAIPVPWISCGPCFWKCRSRS